MTILYFRNLRCKLSKPKPASCVKAPIELTGITSNGESTLLFLRRGRERRQVRLDDIDLSFHQRARRAAWNSAVVRWRRSSVQITNKFA